MGKTGVTAKEITSSTTKATWWGHHTIEAKQQHATRREVGSITKLSTMRVPGQPLRV